jgi:peroxiredoxin
LPSIPLFLYNPADSADSADLSRIPQRIRGFRIEGANDVKTQARHFTVQECLRWLVLSVPVSGCLSLISGCGQPTANPQTAKTEANADGEATGLPTTSIPNPLATAQPDDTSTASVEAATTADSAVPAEPEQGTPEWLIREIQTIRLLPFPSVAKNDANGVNEAGDDADEEPESAATESAAPAELSAADLEARKARLEQIRNLRKERNQQIVKLATEALALSHKDPTKETVFLASVSHLLDAHFQLALQGEQDSVDHLYDAAQVFFDRNPESPAASEAQLTLVNLAHHHARSYAQSEPQWLKEFATQAQLYATRFPREQARSLPQVLAAGRSCELHGLTDQARSCYTLIATKYPESPQAQQISGILRRMQLVGKTCELAGPTLDGNFLNITDFRGKPTIVIFWATHAKPFTDQVTTLQALVDKYKKYSHVLSVSLDSEEAAVDQFLEQTQLTWPVIFHVEPDRRGWNAPIAAYYGVFHLPTIWLIDAQGQVVSTDVSVSQLEPLLRETVTKQLAAGKKTTESKSAPE